MNPLGLTRRQADALATIIELTRRSGGVAPSYGELQVALGISSRGAVHRLIRCLIARGHLEHTPGSARSLRAVGSPGAGEALAELIAILRRCRPSPDGIVRVEMPWALIQALA
jgi:SOS-response transcriptional repressor LexA